jgi:cell division protein FtsI (penicillin-binding protein 3)
MARKKTIEISWVRYWILVAILLSLVGSLVWRAIHLQLNESSFLKNQGDVRHIREIEMPAYRGMIVDREGEPLAVSTPVGSVWMDPAEIKTPSELQDWREKLPSLAVLLEKSPNWLNAKLQRYSEYRFVYLKRHLAPALIKKIKKLKFPGIHVQREYHRFYPSSEVTAHVLGFTDIDDNGLEGLELRYDEWLQGTAGRVRVIKDLKGNVIEHLDTLLKPRPGQKLQVSIDQRLQFLAYKALKKAVRKHQASSGTLVILQASSGEILALVNQPDFNPNNSSERQSLRYRNRAATDIFEPGSTIKPFTMAIALENQIVTENTVIDTSPGYLQIQDYTVRDFKNYGSIDMGTIIRKSSNVGVCKIALKMPAEMFSASLSASGFGMTTESTLPGESGGKLSDFQRWQKVDRCTHAYGYGLSVTALQLAKAYTVFANQGRLMPLSILPRQKNPTGQVVFQPKVANSVLRMMEQVVSKAGSGKRATVPGYRVAGKTGTVHKIGKTGYVDKYLSLFAGIVPVSDPQLIMVVIVDNPSTGGYYGGVVAAPVFADVMTDALRLLNIPPDR